MCIRGMLGIYRRRDAAAVCGGRGLSAWSGGGAAAGGRGGAGSGGGRREPRGWCGGQGTAGGLPQPRALRPCRSTSSQAAAPVRDGVAARCGWAARRRHLVVTHSAGGPHAGWCFRRTWRAAGRRRRHECRAQPSGNGCAASARGGGPADACACVGAAVSHAAVAAGATRVLWWLGECVCHAAGLGSVGEDGGARCAAPLRRGVRS